MNREELLHHGPRVSVVTTPASPVPIQNEWLYEPWMTNALLVEPVEIICCHCWASGVQAASSPETTSWPLARESGWLAKICVYVSVAAS